MDWQLCLICQKTFNEDLKCPLKVHGSGDKSVPYRSFLDRVKMFRELSSLPLPLDHLDGNIVLHDLVANRASWHKSCYGKFSNDKIERARKRAATHSEVPYGEMKRVRSTRKSLDNNACLFCEERSGILHEFVTMDADTNVRNMATDLQDTALLAKIGGGDLHALEAKYHMACLTKLRNSHRSLKREEQEIASCNIEEKKIEVRALTELLSYVETSVEEGMLCFKLSELRFLYQSRLNNFGISKEINKVRFKELLLSHFPDAQAQNDGKNILLIFKQEMQKMLKQAFQQRVENDALILSKAAKIIRDDIFNFQGLFKFSGSLPSGCQQNSLPTNLKYLVSMLLNGPNIKDQDSVESQSSLTIAQMILFNCKKRPSVTDKSRHNLNFEPPLPLYVGMKIHTQTRSKKLVMEMNELGLSVSYDRILQLENQLANSVCLHAKEIGLVCPSQLRHGLFTVGALDNLDHNPSSTTAKDSFHGTGISLFQFCTESNVGQLQSIELSSSAEIKNCYLPEEYTTVPAVVLKKECVSVPNNCNSVTAVNGYLEEAKSKEIAWLQHAVRLLNKYQLECSDAVTWAAYHASLVDVDTIKPALSQLIGVVGGFAGGVLVVYCCGKWQLVHQRNHNLQPSQPPPAPLYEDVIVTTVVKDKDELELKDNVAYGHLK